MFRWLRFFNASVEKVKLPQEIKMKNKKREKTADNEIATNGINPMLSDARNEREFAIVKGSL